MAECWRPSQWLTAKLCFTLLVLSRQPLEQADDL